MQCSVGNVLLCQCDVGGYFGRHIDGLDAVYGGHSIAQRNLVECC